MLSIIIPAYREPFLQKTIDSLRKNSISDIEIIAVENNLGMRNAVNQGIARAKGDFIMKCDAHCLFAPGYDKALTENCAENWLVIPRRYSVEEETWTRDEKRGIRDYHYLTFPHESDYGYGMQGKEWNERSEERKDPKYDVDDQMSFQGSCWVANTKYFKEHIGTLDDRIETYGGFAQEPQEIGLKYWLGGGENKIVKKTWYAHLSKRKKHYDAAMFSRRYKKDPRTLASHTWSSIHWLNDREPNMKYKFEWLLEKFAPVPTWPVDWREIWEGYHL